MESINTLQDTLKVVTPLKSSDGELKVDLTIGSVPTLGEQAGEKKVSSELPSENAELTAPSTDVHPLLAIQWISFNEHEASRLFCFNKSLRIFIKTVINHFSIFI